MMHEEEYKAERTNNRTGRYEFSAQTKADSNGKVHLQRYGIEWLYENNLEFREKFDEHPWLACCWYSSIVEQDYDLRWDSCGEPYINLDNQIRNKVSSRVFDRDERWTVVLDIDRDMEHGWDITVEPTYITLHDNGHSQMIWVLTRPVDKDYANQLTDMVKVLINDGTEDCFCHGFKGLVHDNPFLFEHVHEGVMYDPDYLFSLLSDTIEEAEESGLLVPMDDNACLCREYAESDDNVFPVDESMDYSFHGAISDSDSRHMYTYMHIREAVEGSSWDNIKSVKESIKQYQMKTFGSCEADAELENFARDFVRNKRKYNNLWTDEERSRGGKIGGRTKGTCKARYGNRNAKGHRNAEGNHNKGAKGMVWMNDGNVTKRVRYEDYDKYIELGWNKGRKI